MAKNNLLAKAQTQPVPVSETKSVVVQPEVVKSLPDKIAEWTRIVGERNLVANPTSLQSVEDLKPKDLILYRIEEITYEEDSPQLEALENALSCMTVPGMNLVYLILGDHDKVRFYFGFVRDLFAVNAERDPVRQVGEAFLKPALEGNFRGSTIRELGRQEMDELRAEMKAYFDEPDNCRVLAGVPGGVKDKEKQDFRGIDRLVDVMQGDKFGFMILAKPIGNDRLTALRKDVFSAYEMLSLASKQSVQLGQNVGQNQGEAVNSGESVSTGTNTSKTTGTNESQTHGGSSGESHGQSHSTNKGKSWSKTAGGSKSTTIGENKTFSTNKGTSKNWGTQSGSSITVNTDLTDKAAADWVKYFDEVLIPRLDYARGKGAFVVNMTLFGENPQVTRKLSQAARSIFAGETANMVPLLSRNPGADECKLLRNFTIPFAKMADEDIQRLPYAQAGLLEYGSLAQFDDQQDPVLYSGNWMSVRELALMAGLPQKEVVGLRLKEEVEFGLNVPEEKGKDGKPIRRKAEDVVELGALVKSGNECKGSVVKLAKNQLDRHVFVAGVTGSGKTTTCQTLLLSSGWPFLVIEPAKTEYRGLRMASDKAIRKQCEDMLVFTLGDDTEAPFRLNPFELIPGESVTSRVDMLMASITAAFDMEAAIPQLIERAIYACYEDYGWSLDTNENGDYDDPFADGVFAFPTLSDVLKKTEAVVEEQGFDDRLKKDYIGSIKARLQGLTLGSKGFMLDCPRSVDFVKLLDRKVVLELEEIPNAAQKSLIIGFVLTNLLQAVKYKFKKSGAKVNHITLIEEAHRLLSKPEPGGSPSQKQAAETFADMLAEIRKYGESLVIADQIPGKLTPEVMKNTNTKIIHRLFAQDDKEAVGHTMGLEEEQANFLSNLQIGRAVVFNGNWPKAIQVQITQTYRTDTTPDPKEAENIRKAALEFYASDWKRGVFACSNLLKNKPDAVVLEKSARKLRDLLQLFRHVGNVVAKECNPLVIPELCHNFGIEVVTSVLSDEDAAAELVMVRNKDVKLEELKFVAISRLGKKFGAESVWAVLSRREYGKQKAISLSPRWGEFLKMMPEFAMNSKNSAWTASLRELRKAFL